MTCKTCAHFDTNLSPYAPAPGWGKCLLILPPWVSRSINKAGENEYLPLVRAQERCSFHSLVEMEGDYEAIHGWGGQG